VIFFAGRVEVQAVNLLVLAEHEQFRPAVGGLAGGERPDRTGGG